jgi:hypothetical protein
MNRPAHIGTLIAELEEFAKNENLGIISPDALRRRLADAAKFLKQLTTPNAFIPLENPGFRVTKAEDYFVWHPELWGKPVQFLAIRDLARPWAVATPMGVNDDGTGHDVAIAWHNTESEAMATAVWGKAAPADVVVTGLRKYAAGLPELPEGDAA